MGAHWSFDAGAEDFTRELVSRLPAVGVLARFSRLLCDANRPLGSDSMFRDTADGLPVELNNPATLTEGQQQSREGEQDAQKGRTIVSGRLAHFFLFLLICCVCVQLRFSAASIGCTDLTMPL